jgi:hypothetical protein
VTEWHLGQDHVSTFEFHEHRERAPHLEQPIHRQRLVRAAELVRELEPASVVDLGCGDGGLLSLIPDIPSWGYDFQPTNPAGWAERGVQAEQLDVFNTREVPRWGELAVMTEVLEHLADPHGVLDWVSHHVTYVVASSPRYENGEYHGDCHAWAWDEPGYRALFEPRFEVLTHEGSDWSQLIVAKSRP